MDKKKNKPKKRPRSLIKIKLRWHQSAIIRATAIATVILFCGYIASIIFSIQGIDSLSQIAHDKDVENTLTNHLTVIREVHKLHQEMIVLRLKTALPKGAWLNSEKTINETMITAWLNTLEIEQIFNVKEAKIKKATPEELASFAREKIKPLAWLDQQTLRIFHLVVNFPKGVNYWDFKVAEAILQRYKFIGSTLQSEIKPTLIKANTIVLMVTFLLLITSFFLLAGRFRKKVQELLDGFALWSETNAKFRFSRAWPGELRLITSQFNVMADEVEANRKRNLFLEKLASWQTIARKLAHEIKNPLTPIQMMVAQLKRRYRGDDSEFQKLLDNAQTIIGEEVAGLRRMVETFSQFARLPVPHPTHQDLKGIIYRIVELEKTAFEQHLISFETSVEEAFCDVDDQLIRQVLINLVKNAAEACGEKRAHIRVILHALPQHFIIAVQDDGPGIPDELQAKIFEAYFTTKHTGPTPGMGLGLAICQKVIIDHGGEITFYSRPGFTQFKIKLPKVNAIKPSVFQKVVNG